MANWCEGTLKLRGRAKDIADLCNDRFNGVKAILCNNNELEITSPDWCHVSGSNSAYIMGCNEGISFDDPHKIITMALPIQEAYSINTGFWSILSCEYGVDIRIHAFEKGMQFEQEIEIICGDVRVNDRIEYDDYVWESPMPLLGG